MNFEATFPLIFLMNLSRREDRRVRSEALFAQHGLNVRRFPAVDALWMKGADGFETKGRRAHALTTRLMIREAKRRRAPAVFIFEDDVVLALDWRERLGEICLPEDWGMFALGGQHHERPATIRPGVVKVAAMLDTHAWGLRAEYYDKVLAALRHCEFDDRGSRPATDVTLARLQARIPTYATWPNAAWQEESHSDLASGAYSNYEADGWQKPAPYAVDGLLAEALGGYAWQPAVEISRGHRAWFKQPGREPGNVRMEPVAEAPAVAKPSNAESGKVAFLFLTRAAHHQPEIWEEYWQGSNAHGVYSHIADPDSRPGGWLEAAKIKDWHQTSWGHVSLVQAQLALLHTALAEPDNSFFVFCSESCVPVRPFSELQRVLRLDGRSRFGWLEWSELLTKTPEKAARTEAAPGLPASQWVFHSQWILLNREAAELIVENDFTGHFRRVIAPDECYAGTVLRAKGYPLNEKLVNSDITWTRWEGHAHPVTLNELTPAQAAAWASSGHFFARKVSAAAEVRQFRLHPPG